MNMEKPGYEKIEKKENYVFEQFHSVGFEIEKSPELFERIVELASMPESHFDDGVKIAEIIDFLWDDLTKEDQINFTKNELKLASLFHDIGKSGPPEANREERFMIEQIFNPLYFNTRKPGFEGRNPKKMTIAEALDVENFSNKEEIKKYLLTLKLHIVDHENHKTNIEDLDLDRHTMIDLWREHDFWTYQLLTEYGAKDISEEVKIVSSTHHTLEGHDPAKIDGDIPNEAVALELLDKYLILTLLDKYQAFIERSGKTHQETIEILQEMIDSSKKNGIMNQLFKAENEERVYDQFVKYLEILARHPEMAEIIKK
jgi:hypothetical protein